MRGDSDGRDTRLAEFRLEQLCEEQVRQLGPAVRGVRPVPFAVRQVAEVDVARVVRGLDSTTTRDPATGSSRSRTSPVNAK
jgi:hypothetical protein